MALRRGFPDALVPRRCRELKMSRHGVRASQQVFGQRGDAAMQLERVASDVGAGVVIAGAYGHSRLSEWILGGVTRRLINPANRCSLLSH
jgi:nucleotide-binding universal stress UspA family protein